MSKEISRPCAAVDLVEVTPEYKGGWGPALSTAPVPWSKLGRIHGFDFVATVRSDDDWNGMVLDPDLGLAMRYVLVPMSDGWELRLGRTDDKSVAEQLKSGGSHRHMFSRGEQEYAVSQGKAIRSGYVYGIDVDLITVG
jgi:hypothetical protein